MYKFYKGPYIDISCKVLLHLANEFQRRSADKEQEMPMVTMFVVGSKFRE